MKFHYLHIVVPQGDEANPKKEHLFQELLVNFHNIVKNKPISLEYFGFEQYTYCYVVVPDDLLETVEGLFYSSYPDCEIKPGRDYTAAINPDHHKVVGTSLQLAFFDVYGFKTYDKFAEDSQSNLFSVISKVSSGEQIWVQIVINPREETAGYHLGRNWNMRFARLRQIFHVRDWMRAKSDDSIKNKKALL